ncbi:MAG: hypothetical protein ACP5G7_05010 [Anaerolineae bacterium]
MHDKEALLQALWRERLHAEPTCLDRSPLEVRQHMETVWDPGRLFRELIRPLPSGMLQLWHETPRGHVVFTHEPSRYIPGPQEWRGRSFDGVCYVRVADLLDEGEEAFLVFAELLDHLMGSAAEQGGGHFSDGVGLTPRLTDAAKRFARDETLGYGHEELGATSPAAYFRRCLWLYLTDERRLNVLDPNTHKLFARTLFQPHVWKAP